MSCMCTCQCPFTTLQHEIWQGWNDGNVPVQARTGTGLEQPHPLQSIDCHARTDASASEGSNALQQRHCQRVGVHKAWS